MERLTPQQIADQEALVAMACDALEQWEALGFTEDELEKGTNT